MPTPLRSTSPTPLSEDLQAEAARQGRECAGQRGIGQRDGEPHSARPEEPEALDGDAGVLRSELDEKRNLVWTN